MNTPTKNLTKIINRASATVGIILVLGGLFVALIFCKNISKHQNLVNNVEPNSSTQSINYQNNQQCSSNYPQQFLTSSILPQACWYIVPEQEATGVRLKTIVTR